VVAIAALALVVSGCGKTTAEKAAEKIVETATNGQADVDLSTNTITINSNGSTYQAGENVSIPASFPSDLYVIDGTVNAALTLKEGEQYSVTITTTKSAAEAKSLYESKLSTDGWTITTNASFATSTSIAAEKGNRNAFVTVTDVDGTVSVGITTSVDENTNSSSNAVDGANANGE